MKNCSLLYLFILIFSLQSCSQQATTHEEIPIRKSCLLDDMYADMAQEIDVTSPDVIFVNAICAGDADKAVSLFREKKLFWDEAPVVDTPYERFEGLDAIHNFADGFLAKFKATSATFNPIFQTKGGGRVALEGVVSFVVDGEIEEVPMFIVFDLRTADSLEEVRMYTNFTFVPDQTPYRKPMFKSSHLEMGDPGLLTGAMKSYYEALHHAPYVIPEELHKSFASDCRIGGYESWGTPMKTSQEMEEEVESFAYRIAAYIPACVGMRYETIIDDGTTCVIEWCHIVSRQGMKERNRVAMSGVSAYQRNSEGYLCSVRICDYSGHESEIDWTKTPISEEEARQINFVEEFPGGCGFNTQQD